MNPAALPRRRAAAPLLALAFSLATAGCESLDDLKAAPSAKEDDAARKKHYEEAAQTYYDGGKYEQSVAQWRKVLDLAPDDQKAKWGLAKSLANMGTFQSLRQSMAIYAEIILLDWVHPTRGDIKFEVERDYAQVHLDLADLFDKDIRALEARLEGSLATEARDRESIANETRARDELLARAIPLYERVLETSRENPYALAGLAKANLLAGDPAKGVEYARRYVAISVESQVQWKSRLADYERELAKDRTKPTEEQREVFRSKIRGAREKEVGMRLLIASVLVRSGDPAGAVAEYDRILELDPARAPAYLERAQARAMAGKYREAVLDLERYLQVTDPVRQREVRIGAADLLEKYRLAAAKSGAPPAATKAPAGP